MTASYRIFSNSHFPRIECEGQNFTEDELHETIWLINMELRSTRLSKREQAAAKRQIAQYGELLAALRSAGA
jgi:hypothetical protein